MGDECCSSNTKTMLVACSGASNLGQIANQVAVELTREGVGKMFCLAAVGAHISNFLFSAQNAQNLVAIDGCPVGCAMRLLEHADVPVTAYVVVQNLGIEKSSQSRFETVELEMAKNAVKDIVNSANCLSPDKNVPCSCCG